MLSSGNVIGFVKNVISLGALRSVQHEHLTLALSLSLSHV